jgi:hypothetical protein
MKSKKVLGWIAVAVTTAFAGFWAYWGSLENFHEGWYYASFVQNLVLALVQYWIWSLTFIVLGAVSLRWPKAGAIVFIAAAVLVPTVGIRTSAAIVIFAIPLAVMGVCWWFGRPEPKKWAYAVIIGIPLLLLVGLSIEPAIRVAGRYGDGNLRARAIEGNAVNLLWAAQGPGWPQGGPGEKMASWTEARAICSRLNFDGTAVVDTPTNFWRLPTVQEAVRSLVQHGTNAGGTWDSVTRRPSYIRPPDKESPLWNVHSPVIYWWTSDQLTDSTAYRVVYNGMVSALPKKLRVGYLGFRAVREVR